MTLAHEWCIRASASARVVVLVGRGIAHKPNGRQYNTGMDINERIAADLAHVRANPDEYGNGTAATIREVAAVNLDIPKKVFVAAMVALGFNASTVAIQFANVARGKG